jgi:hypothetical protein
MSDRDDHAAANAGIPVSAGIPPMARFLMAGAVLIVFMQGAFVIAASVYGRIWPSLDSVHVPLH